MVYLIICVAVFIVLGIAAVMRSSQISEQERREFYEEYGYWPEW